MKTHDYDTDYNKNTGGTDLHIAVDTKMKQTGNRKAVDDPASFEEGFASASGVRPETAETGGRIKHPETKDAPRPNHKIDLLEEEENSGLADS
jgi:hypothetical protein